MSIKFPDLQVLFPRAHETSRAEQLNQRQADMSQAQAAAQSQQEISTKRKQVLSTEKQTRGHISEREGRGQRQLPQRENDEAGNKSEDDCQNMSQTDLGRKIDIRI